MASTSAPSPGPSSPWMSQSSALPLKLRTLRHLVCNFGSNTSYCSLINNRFTSDIKSAFILICFIAEGKYTHIVQNLSFQLGHNLTEKIRERHMATILKLSRGHYMPPPFTSVSDWFHYAFASAETKGQWHFSLSRPYSWLYVPLYAASHFCIKISESL